MNIYVETNFVLELAFVQEQHESCEQIMGLCEAGGETLVLPAFSIAESYETLIRRAIRRTQIANDLAKELRQLARSKPYQEDIDAFQSKIADIISLELEVVLNATRHRVVYKLEPQDSIVYSSVLHHLVSVGGGESCFVNRNSRDFDDPDIEESLANKGCKMLFSFVNAFNYIQYRMT